jgi:type I restriction-modification system DNA methylase subunit
MSISAQLQLYGVPESNVKPLQGATPDLLDYLDLVGLGNEATLLPDYVAESQGQPLLYIVDQRSLSYSHLPQESQYSVLRHTLACRGQRAYLARLLPGELRVIPVESTKDAQWQIYSETSTEALSFFPRLALGHYDGKGDSSQGDFVFEQMFKLLDQVATTLDEYALQPADILSLVGRTLFFRFLCDRQIIKEDNVKAIAPLASSLEDCFETAENATSTCAWLDKTFNGNFLPLSGDSLVEFFRDVANKTHNSIFDHLTAIARAYQAVGGRNYQSRLQFNDWQDFNFAHVPVGLLSQVHEKFAWRWDPYAGSTSVHYTPRNIAWTLVQEVFDGLPEAYKARVLDPASGAGVFMVLAFRQLYKERWNFFGARPDTEAIRDILMNQLVGFDISMAAVKLAALSLYLTAIELDPEPIPPEKLTFRDLHGEVLFCFRDIEEPPEGPVLGSLKPEHSSKFNGRFDLVISNPPWTKLSKTVAPELTQISRHIIERRGAAALASRYHNPNNGPDLPFVWKATEWCKPNGRIGMVLHARILLGQEQPQNIARQTLLTLLEVNGIINCSNLSDSPVWPKMNQPFLLMFASNRVPAENHALYFVTPHYDAKLNSRGEIWIDSKSALPINVTSTFQEPWLWKALTVGTALDVDVIRKIKAVNGKPLAKYWNDDLGLSSSSGYQIADKQLVRQDARPLQVLPNLDSTTLFTFAVDVSKLQLFSEGTACRTRLQEHGDSLQVYRAPLVLIKESPGYDRERGWALLSRDDVAFNESFYGYSAARHKDADLLTQYLHIFVHSAVWIYYALLTSPTLGAERRRINKNDLDECVIVPLDLLSDSQKTSVTNLSSRLLEGDWEVFEEIDNFFAALYGLDALDFEVIRDTLKVSFPYKPSRQRAYHSPSSNEYEEFRQHLESLLAPFFEITNQKIQVAFSQPTDQRRLFAFGDPPLQKAPFGVLLISTTAKVQSLDEALWLKIVQIATQNGATRIFYKTDDGLGVALLSQYRYWTPTRARLVAAEIARYYLDVFEE